MTFNKILVDTNVCLDVILNRKPYATPAIELIGRTESGDFSGVIAAHAVDTIFYILSKQLGKRKAYEGISIIREAFNVADVTQSAIDNALQLRWPDFEDAVHYQATLQAGCDAIITRNQADFENASLPALSPYEFLEMLGMNR